MGIVGRAQIGRGWGLRLRVAARLFPVLLVIGGPPLWGTPAAGEDGDGGAPGEPTEGTPGYEETVVVTATRMETPLERLASSVVVIGRQEIERREARTVAELLEDVPGVVVARNGGPGGTASVFLRGAKSEHTLVLIDGVVANDPSSPGRSFDFAHLATANIERVEVVFGPQSTVYGSDAMGGIVQIFTRRGGEGAGGEAFLEGGSFGTWNSGAAARGGGEEFDWSLAFGRQDTEGISAAGEEFGNTEADGYEQDTASARLGLRPSEGLELAFLARWTDEKGGLDNFGGSGGDDPNYLFGGQQALVRGEARLRLLDGRWRQTLAVDQARTERDYENGEDPGHPGEWLTSDYAADTLAANWQNDLVLGENHLVTAGVSLAREAGRSNLVSGSPYGTYEETFPDSTADTWALYIQDQLSLGGRFFATVGLRRDAHDLFGVDTNVRLAPALLLAEGRLKLRASVATGFKAPSLYQLHSIYGNPQLEPEESASWEGGADWQARPGLLELSLTVHRSDFRQLIDFDFDANRYQNVGRARTSGVELAARTRPARRLDLRGNVALLRAEDLSTGEDLLRRPSYTAGLDAWWEAASRLSAGLTVLRVGPREDLDFSLWPASRAPLDPYTLVDAVVKLSMGEHWEAWLSGHNLLDQRYETVFGFGEPGIGVYAGLRARL